MDKVSVRAINPDNKVEIDSLINFIKNSLPESYPIKSVFDDKYWQNHLGSRFFSLVAKNEAGEILAHIGICRDALANHIRIVYPVIKPNLKITSSFKSAITSFLNNLKIRQGWDLYYYFLLNENLESARSLHELLGGEIIAVCPNYFQGGDNSTTGQTVSIVMNMLVEEVETRGKEIPVYVPKNHLDIIQTIYKQIPLTRIIKSDAKTISAVHLPAEALSVEIKSFSQTNVAHVSIEPSLVSNSKEMISQLRGINSGSHIIFLNIRDPLAPTVAATLENEGYLFTGALPLILNKECLVYSKPTGDFLLSDPINKKTAKLYDYVLEQSSIKTQSIAPTISQPRKIETVKLAL